MKFKKSQIFRSLNNKYINELDFEIDFVQALDDEFMQ